MLTAISEVNTINAANITATKFLVFALLIVSSKSFYFASIIKLCISPPITRRWASM